MIQNLTTNTLYYGAPLEEPGSLLPKFHPLAGQYVLTEDGELLAIDITAADDAALAKDKGIVGKKRKRMTVRVKRSRVECTRHFSIKFHVIVIAPLTAAEKRLMKRSMTEPSLFLKKEYALSHPVGQLQLIFWFAPT